METSNLELFLRRLGLSPMAVPLSGKYGRGKYAWIDAEDWPKVAGYTWNVVQTPRSDGTYGLKVQRSKGRSEPTGKYITMSAQIMGRLRYVYTVNGNGLDCRKANFELRLSHGRKYPGSRNLPRSLSDAGSRMR